MLPFWPASSRTPTFAGGKGGRKTAVVYSMTLSSVSLSRSPWVLPGLHLCGFNLFAAEGYPQDNQGAKVCIEHFSSITFIPDAK